MLEVHSITVIQNYFIDLSSYILEGAFYLFTPCQYLKVTTFPFTLPIGMEQPCSGA